MIKIITDATTKVFYVKGDKVVNKLNNREYEVLNVIADKKMLVTTDGNILELTTDIRPSAETEKKCRVIDKKTKRENTRPMRRLDNIFFAKVREDAIIPSKRYEDGAYDIYANFAEDEIIIKSGEIKMIPTGIASAFSPKYRMILKERGSSGTKGMAVRCGVIDSGYRNEWFVPINNTTNKTIIISKNVTATEVTDEMVLYPYSKAVCQADLEIVPNVVVKEITLDELKSMESERGQGCLGSSGK